MTRSNGTLSEVPGAAGGDRREWAVPGRPAVHEMDLDLRGCSMMSERSSYEHVPDSN
jgi:hypothetical protein